ncbi:STAS domain-containing protein [Amycolatopsis magusensis]|uniref:STAS domain-containing protein n=1 Tax=Amycolatopsis magusensis TaxID=882444 RepID=UPI0034D5F2A9
MHFDFGDHDGCSVVRVAGELDLLEYPRLRDTLFKCAVEQPPAVLVVVDELIATTPSLLSVFAQAWNRLSDWPNVPVFLVATGEPMRRVLREASVARFVPVFESLADAANAVATEPRRRYTKIGFRRLPDTARLARDFTRQVCLQWLPKAPITPDALLVVNELVDNVLVHTDSEPTLRLELRANHFSIAVSDSSSTPARLREGIDGANGGLGLRLVAQLTKTWGSTPALSGGKVVWGVLVTNPRTRVFQPFSVS